MADRSAALGNARAPRTPRRWDRQTLWSEATGYPPPYYVPLRPWRPGDVPGYKMVVFSMPSDEALRGVLTDAGVPQPDLIDRGGRCPDPFGEPLAVLTWRSSADAVRAKSVLAEHLRPRGAIAEVAWWLPANYSPWDHDERFADLPRR